MSAKPEIDVQHLPDLGTAYLAGLHARDGAKDRRIKELELSLIIKINIGDEMASVLFNFAQKIGHTLTGDDVALFDKLRQRWGLGTGNNKPYSPMADRLEVLEREHKQFFVSWHQERRKREALELLVDDYKSQLSAKDTH
jgi:hypothetical protein